MTAGRLNVAVAGLGVGEQHVAAFMRQPHCTVRWVFDRDAARMATVADATPGSRQAKDFQTIIDDPTVDVVSIATYDQDHCEQVVTSLNAGKHVFVEKPLCRSERELERVECAWQAQRRHLSSNLVLRAAPLYQWLHDAIAGGELGGLYSIDGDYLYGRHHKITDGWRGDTPDYSVTVGGGIHLVDLMIGLSGQRPRAVAAAGNRICSSGSRFRYNDFVAATYRFDSGLIGRITANFGCVHRHQHVLRVFGTKATFVYDDRGARLHTGRDGQAPAIPIDHAPLPPSKGELIAGFVTAILQADSAEAGTRREFDVVRACFAADRAVAGGGEVEIVYS